MAYVMAYIKSDGRFRNVSSVNSPPFKRCHKTRRRIMNDYFEDFNSTNACEIAVGVFIALAAFHLARAIVRASFA